MSTVMNNIIALEECPGCGVILGLAPEVEQLDFSGKSFSEKKIAENVKKINSINITGLLDPVFLR